MSKLSDLVKRYLRDKASDLDDELAYFRGLPFPSAVEEAANARGPDGKVLSHQRKPGKQVLGRAAKKLLACLPQIKACKSFEKLLDLIYRETDDVVGFGKLCRYDTALRIGANLKLSPTLVYLHAGTLKGAKMLGFKTKDGILTRKDISAHRPEVHYLRGADQIESFLCWLTHHWPSSSKS
jgi:hypothetical protein